MATISHLLLHLLQVSFTGRRRPFLTSVAAARSPDPFMASPIASPACAHPTRFCQIDDTVRRPAAHGANAGCLRSDVAGRWHL